MKKSKMTRSKKAIFAGFLSAAMVAQSVSAFAAEAGGEYLPDLQTQNQEVVSETAGESSPAAETAPGRNRCTGNSGADRGKFCYNTGSVCGEKDFYRCRNCSK